MKSILSWQLGIGFFSPHTGNIVALWEKRGRKAWCGLMPSASGNQCFMDPKKLLGGAIDKMLFQVLPCMTAEPPPCPTAHAKATVLLEISKLVKSITLQP